MKKILLVGLSPLPIQDSQYNHAGGIRTWLFIQKIIKIFPAYQLDVHLLHANTFDSSPFQPTFDMGLKNITIHTASENAFHKGYLKQVLSRQQYDAVISINTYPSYFMSLEEPAQPWWADLQGDPVAEGQCKSFADSDNNHYINAVEMTKSILSHADYFSSCSYRQKLSIIGQLGMVGKLVKENEGIDLVSSIPLAVPPAPLNTYAKNSRFFRIIWIGGYNTWADGSTLFNALYFAFQARENIRFISTGGIIKGHSDYVYSNFLQAVQDSEYANRCELKGYVDNEELDQLLFTSHLGLNIDRFSYEGYLGGRNRINTFTHYGLPTITTATSEIPHELEKIDAVMTYPAGDYHTCAQKIIWAADHPNEISDMQKRAQKYLLEEAYAEKHYQAFYEWLENPLKSHTLPLDISASDPPNTRIDKKLMRSILKFGYSNALRAFISGNSAES